MKALLGKDFKYFKILGSQSKIGKMFRNLLAEGFPPEILDGIHGPVGLPIKSQTPDEIAVSIAAGIIQVKTQHNI